MAAKKTPARRTTTRKTVHKTKTISRKAIARKPLRGSTWYHRAAARLALILVAHAQKHRAIVRTRKDAAILRATHAGCTKCGGTGTLYTKGKDGAFTGSKPCPATPTATKVSRYQVAKQARFGVDKNSGLIGWRCPCGKNEKPRYRDAKAATAAIRTHERTKHGGQTVGARWYAQLPEGAKAPAEVTAAKPKAAPVSKVVTNSGMTDKQWEGQNSGLSPRQAEAKGRCWQCGGHGTINAAFGGEQRVVVCGECQGTGKAAQKASA